MSLLPQNYLDAVVAIETPGTEKVIAEQQMKGYLNMLDQKFIEDQLSEILADFEDLSDEELISCRETIKDRVIVCIEKLDYVSYEE